MGRAPCCSKEGLQRGPWAAIEDSSLIDYIRAHGEGNWRSLPEKAGLLRCGKSCRLRWMNYLKPGIKRGNITPDEDDLIIRLHSLLGNRWSLIAGRLPGRTDNEIKNYWNCQLKKRSVMGKTLEKPCTKNKKSCEIYRPKPFRVSTAWTNNIYNSSTSASTSNNAGEEDKGSTPMPWPEADNRGGNGVIAGGDGLVHNQHDDEFEKLYLEYVQLLMADDSVAAVEL